MSQQQPPDPPPGVPPPREGSRPEGSWEDVTRLAEALAASASEWSRRAAAHVEQVRPEVFAHLGDAASSLAAAFTELTRSRPTSSGTPGGGGSRSPEDDPKTSSPRPFDHIDLDD